MSSGIYKITSKVSGKIYIGSAVNLVKRWHNHLSDLRKGKHSNPRLQNHANKYGIDDLIFEYLEEVPLDELLVREQWYIDGLRPFFNVCKTAGSSRGCKASEETRKKQSLAKLGKPSARKDYTVSEETREKLRKANTGKPGWNKGKKTPEHVIKKLRESHLGQKQSPEQIEAFRKRLIGHKFNLGRKHSAETRKKVSDALKGVNTWITGRKLPPEVIAKREATKKANRQKLLENE